MHVYLIFLCVSVFSMHIRAHTMCVPGARVQKKVPDPLKLESQTVVNQTQVLAQAHPVLLTSEPSLQILIFVILKITLELER